MQGLYSHRFSVAAPRSRQVGGRHAAVSDQSTAVAERSGKVIPHPMTTYSQDMTDALYSTYQHIDSKHSLAVGTAVLGTHHLSLLQQH